MSSAAVPSRQSASPLRFFATVERTSDAPSTDLASALKKSEARSRFLAETIPVQVWTSRPNGMLDYVSSFYGLPR